MNASTVFIGIPILNRTDLLKRCVDSIDLPAEIVIVNNNTVDPGFRRDLHALAGRIHGTVLDQHRNVGVAASWNLLARTAFERGHSWVFLGSNDTILKPGSLCAALAMPKEDSAAIWHIRAADFFLIRRKTIDHVGWFDENFYPAYDEDMDYKYRCRLAGVEERDVPGAGADHVGSATIHSDPIYFAKNSETHGLNRRYYVAKWGGLPTQEQFDKPFDDPGRDHRWWPEPDDSLAARDWDIERRGILSGRSGRRDGHGSRLERPIRQRPV